MRIAVCDDDGKGFTLENRRGFMRISFAELEYVEVMNKTVSFHLADGSVREVSAALAEVEETLVSHSEIIKTHRSYLVNLRHVRDVTAGHVMTKSGHAVPISRKRRRQVQDACLHFLSGKEALPAADAPEAELLMPKQAGGPWRILLVDDDAVDLRYWADILCSHGCIVYQAQNSWEALALAEDFPCDCVILDVNIHGEDGFAVCKKIREQTSLPVIFLSCLTETDKQMEGFSAGGIDYITKDTPAELFWAKVQTRIRLAASERTQLSYGPLLLDLAARRVSVDGKELPLTSIEFDLLWQLSEHPEHVFTPEEIFSTVWGTQPLDGGQTVQVHMSRLRRKLERVWNGPHFIETVWGQGYRFVLPKHWH